MKKIRFSLRALLRTVTAAAVAFGVYWLVWPQYQAYREKSNFEAAAKQFKPGITPEAAKALLPRPKLHSTTFSNDTKRQHVTYSGYIYGTAVYCVVFYGPQRGIEYVGPGMKAPCRGVEVYRLPPMPKDYRFQSQLDDQANAYYDAHPESGYLNDFFSIVSGLAVENNDNIQLQYELIHADPVDIRDQPAPNPFRRGRTNNR